MKTFLIIFILIFLILIEVKASSTETLYIDLKFYIPNDITMTERNVEMKSWMEEKYLKKLVQYTNNIYEENFKKYKIFPIIQFNYSSLTRLDVLSAPRNKNIEERLKFISETTREDSDKRQKTRAEYIRDIFGKKVISSNDNKKNINVYIVPYIGISLGGYAKKSIEKKDLYISEWLSRENIKPFKQKINHLSKVFAHEIGHTLLLEHHKNIDPKYLMHGGTLLKKEEVETVLESAKEILD